MYSRFSLHVYLFKKVTKMCLVLHLLVFVQLEFVELVDP